MMDYNETAKPEEYTPNGLKTPGARKQDKGFCHCSVTLCHRGTKGVLSQLSNVYVSCFMSDCEFECTPKLTRKCWQVFMRCKPSLPSPGEGQTNLRCVVPPLWLPPSKDKQMGEKKKKTRGIGKAWGSFSAGSVFLFCFATYHCQLLGGLQMLFIRRTKKDHMFFYPNVSRSQVHGHRKITNSTIME